MKKKADITDAAGMVLIIMVVLVLVVLAVSACILKYCGEAVNQMGARLEMAVFSDYPPDLY